VLARRQIRIGDGTYLNRNTEIVAARSVTIGRDCQIGRDVLIMDTDQHAMPGREMVIDPVVIEDRVWIGARAIILKGVRIGHERSSVRCDRDSGPATALGRRGPASTGTSQSQHDGALARARIGHAVGQAGRQHIHRWTPSVQSSHAEHSGPPDDAVIVALAERDLGALATLYDRYGRLAYALAYRILGEGEAAEDVVHDAYISPGEAPPATDGSAATSAAGSCRSSTTVPWTSSGARRPSARRRSRQRPSGRPTTTRRGRHAECRAPDRSCRSEGLPQAQRRTIELAYFGGYTHVELAELMGVPLGTVKGRMRIGLQKLRRALELQGTYRERPR
jgi:RNA polymerase sigma-70 factor (ECF subfamily)